MPKRNERVAPPPPRGGWDFRFATGNAVKGWEQIWYCSDDNRRTVWMTDASVGHPKSGVRWVDLPARALCE